MEDTRENTNMQDNLSDIITQGYSQPILFLKKAPNVNTIVNLIKNNDSILLHNAPIAATSTLNATIFDALQSDSKAKEAVSDAVDNGLYQLNNEQINLTAEEFSNYIIQNTTIAFCSMVDFTGPIFRSIIDYLPIKKYVVDSLQSSISVNGCSDIKNFLLDYMYNSGPNSFGNVFNIYLNPRDKNLDKDLNRLYEANHITAGQLAQIIYTKLCSACDKAITESLLGTRVTPNKPYIIDKACKYYNIKNTGIETAHEIYYRLNIDFVKMIDNLMSYVVYPMCNNVFQSGLFSSLFYIFKLSEGKNILKETKPTIVNDYPFT